jgi:hypothetical protein
MIKRPLSDVVKVKFINLHNVHEEYYPVPAKNMLPEWFKQTPGFIKSVDINSVKGKYMDEYGSSSSTVKHCMPVYDSITAGYIIVTHEDLIVDGDIEGPPFFFWTNDNNPAIGFQSTEQAEQYPDKGSFDIPKWTSNWAYITPPGYSCLFVSPMHRDTPIRVLEGVVDTDTYNSKVQFPFLLKDKNWRGLIPAGTPIVQVIPFKRESYEFEVSEKQEDFKTVDKVRSRLNSVFLHRYKRKFWSRKEYN